MTKPKKLIPETCEALAKTAIESEFVKAVPWFGSVAALLDIYNSFSDRVLAAKITVFVEPLADAPDELRNELERKILVKDEEFSKVGEVAFLTVQQAADFDKPRMVAIALLGLLDQTIDAGEFKRICQAINSSLLVDLRALALLATEKPSKDHRALVPLVAHNLAEAASGTTWGDNGQLLYGATSLGRKFAQVYSKWKHLDPGA